MSALRAFGMMEYAEHNSWHDPCSAVTQFLLGGSVQKNYKTLRLKIWSVWSPLASLVTLASLVSGHPGQFGHPDQSGHSSHDFTICIICIISVLYSASLDGFSVMFYVIFEYEPVS